MDLAIHTIVLVVANPKNYQKLNKKQQTICYYDGYGLRKCRDVVDTEGAIIRVLRSVLKSCYILYNSSVQSCVPNTHSSPFLHIQTFNCLYFGISNRYKNIYTITLTEKLPTE